jgi:uncharacterized membrane protein YesL
MRRPALNRFISQAADQLALSLLWLVGCLPLVTAPAATAALFEVVRQRRRGDEPAIGASFLAAFRQYLRTSMVVGYGWAALGAVLAGDLVIVDRMGLPAGDALRVALLALLVLYALGSVALFPVLVSYQARPFSLMRTAVLVAVLFPGRALLGLAALAAAAMAVWAVPLAVIVAPGLAATAIQRLYGGVFDRLRNRAGDRSAGPRQPVPVLH